MRQHQQTQLSWFTSILCNDAHYDCALPEIACLSTFSRKSECNVVLYADCDTLASIIYFTVVLLFSADPKGVTKVLAQGLTRLAKTGTWRQWQWDASSKPHTTAASFRQAAIHMITFQNRLMPCQTSLLWIQAEFWSVLLMYWIFVDNWLLPRYQQHHNIMNTVPPLNKREQLITDA